MLGVAIGHPVHIVETGTGVGDRPVSGPVVCPSHPVGWSWSLRSSDPAGSRCPVLGWVRSLDAGWWIPVEWIRSFKRLGAYAAWVLGGSCWWG